MSSCADDRPNTRTDYGKMKKLLQFDKLDGERKGIIRKIAEEEQIVTQLYESFSAYQIPKAEIFPSLLFYYGMLTIKGTRGSSSFWAFRTIMSASSIMVIWKRSIRQRLMWMSTSSPITIMIWHTMVSGKKDCASWRMPMPRFHRCVMALRLSETCRDSSWLI